MNGGLWKTTGVKDTTIAQLATRYGLPRKVAGWLAARNVDPQEVSGWLDPRTIAWTDPAAFADMGRAVERLLQARDASERVCIVGDYDVDGVTASVVVAEALSAAGIQWDCLIPHRVENGYGLSVDLVAQAQALGATLLLTVDNGVRAAQALQHAVQSGIDVIVTDHHERGDSLPIGATAVVHYALALHADQKRLSGAGVAWKLARALLDACGLVDDAERNLWLLGLAALGALADVMPMRGENRRLVVEGIEALRHSTRPGWTALCEVAGVDIAELTQTSVAWSLTPRLNAAGRMDSAMVAFNLLTASNGIEAMNLAQQIETWNRLRREQTQQVYIEAQRQAVELQAEGLAGAVVVSGDWNLGIAGIVAAKLVGEFGRPAIVLTGAGNGTLRGSGRAPDGFPLHQLVSECAQFLDHFGGHEAAIGCQLQEAQLGEFRDALDAVSRRIRVDGMSDPAEPIADDFLPIAEANLATLEWVERFAPYGPEHEPLRFYVGPVKVRKVTPLAGGLHVRVTVQEGTAEADLIWFNAPQFVHEWGALQSVGAVVELERNTWRGVSKVQLRVVEGHALERPLLREDFGYLYRLLQARRKCRAEETELPGRTVGELRLALDAFVELGFAQFEESAYHVVDEVVPRDLRESASYQRHLQSAMPVRRKPG